MPAQHINSVTRVRILIIETLKWLVTTTNKSTYRRNPDTLKKWTHSRRLYNDNETQSAGDSLHPERGADRAVTPSIHLVPYRMWH